MIKFSWKSEDRDALQLLIELLPDARVGLGQRNAYIQFPTLKAFHAFMAELGQDEDLAGRAAPLGPSQPNTEPPHWWYTLNHVGGLRFQPRVCVPPRDICVVVDLLRR